MTDQTATETAALTLADLAKTFESTVWDGRRVYVKGFAVSVYLTIDSDGDVHAHIGTGTGISGRKWDAIFASIERRIDAAHGERTLYT